MLYGYLLPPCRTLRVHDIGVIKRPATTVSFFFGSGVTWFCSDSTRDTHLSTYITYFRYALQQENEDLQQQDPAAKKGR